LKKRVDEPTKSRNAMSIGFAWWLKKKHVAQKLVQKLNGKVQSRLNLQDTDFRSRLKGASRSLLVSTDE
jgi:hypothetical protein